MAAVLMASPTQVFPAATIGIYEDDAGSDCHLAGTPGGFTDYYVVAVPFGDGLTGVQFAAPLPPCAGASYIGETVVPGLFSIGNSQSGIAIALGACRTEPAVVLMTIRVGFAPGTATCCPWPVVADPSAPGGNVIATACHFVEIPATALTAWLNDDGSCEHPAPDNPSPANGAADVPLPVEPSWDEHRPNYCGDPMYTLDHNVYFGTEPDPPLAAQQQDPPYDPGSLQPNTTYYWRVEAFTGLSQASSPVWSFTTPQPLAVEKTTWGAIKALFR
jgi:hypothetical protein